MICAVASGKGGTGKTTVTAGLAAVWDRPFTAVDLDVEEPNLHLFLHPDIESEVPAMMEVPVLDAERCTSCGQCAAFCRYKALAFMGGHLLVFSDMCHGCGGCLALCPEGALSPGERELGQVLAGSFEASAAVGRARFLMGRLRVGEAMSPPLMRQVKTKLPRRPTKADPDVLIDSPPGVSCPAVNAVMDADCVVLVTEPTPFGLHDLKLAVEAFRPLGMPLGVVVNRAGVGGTDIQGYCAGVGVPVWAEIPFSRAIAGAYARGEVPARVAPEAESAALTLMKAVRAAVAGSREADHA